MFFFKSLFVNRYSKFVINFLVKRTETEVNFLQVSSWRLKEVRMDDCKKEGSPGCMQLICKFYLPAICIKLANTNCWLFCIPQVKEIFYRRCRTMEFPRPSSSGWHLQGKNFYFPPQFLFFCFFTPLSLGRDARGEVIYKTGFWFIERF